MSQPYGFERRNDPGLWGFLARWWVERRRRAIRAALAGRR